MFSSSSCIRSRSSHDHGLGSESTSASPGTYNLGLRLNDHALIHMDLIYCHQIWKYTNQEVPGRIHSYTIAKLKRLSHPGELLFLRH